MDLKDNKKDIRTQEIYTVSRLNFEIKKALENNFFNVYVEGEVSNFYCHNNKHYYFDLKDEYSKIKVVMFYEANKKIKFNIEDGLHLILLGYVSVYEKRGEYQFIAVSAEPAGKGALILAFEQLKAKLEEKGYFDQAHKKPVPILPGKIGAVTSTGGAVIKDIVSVLTKRFENFHLVVRNVNVQGATSQGEICDAIDDLCRFGVDVIIIARGGGSLEDLWAFNTEVVADKVFSCPVPVISAVGHETDYTICDFVADARAATPSVAAGMVITDKEEAVKNILFFSERIKTLVKDKISSGKMELRFLKSSRIFKDPGILLADRWQSYDMALKEMNESLRSGFKSKVISVREVVKLFSRNRIMDDINLKKMFAGNYLIKVKMLFSTRITVLKNTIKNLVKDLQSNSPITVLEKGFSFIMDPEEKNVIRSASQLKEGDDIKAVLRDGILLSRVLNIIHKKFNIEKNLS